jgi:DNA-binding NtrC family response regulator
MSFRQRLLHLALEAPIGEILGNCFRRSDWECEEVYSAYGCIERLREQPYDLLLLGRDLPGATVEQVVEEALRALPALRVAVIAGEPDIEEAMRLARCGAFAYVAAESRRIEDLIHLEQRVRSLSQSSAARPFERRGGGRDALAAVVGDSKAIRDISELVRLVAPRLSTVLIQGPTGTGKELIARAIHAASARWRQPLVMVNCGAIPENLIEAEFFGHVKGAFTGATGPRTGHFEQAHQGTIFLDEVSEMPFEMQSKLLRVLQEREFQRVGSSDTVKVDVRVVAATNRELRDCVERGTFREDLYYRLNVVPIVLPRLAERVEDIPLLVEHLLRKTCDREELPLKHASSEALLRLMEQNWPGNVRQLENAVEKAVALSGSRSILYPSDFPLNTAAFGAAAPLAAQVKLPAEGIDFDSVVSSFERSLLEQALDRCKGNKKRAAELLRIKRTTFTAKLRSIEQSAVPGRV